MSERPAGPGRVPAWMLDPRWRADHEVAAAAEAWLHAPRDHEAYRRLVVAVERRRDTLDQHPEQDPGLADQVVDLVEVKPVGFALSGTAEEVLTRLRAGLPAPDPFADH